MKPVLLSHSHQNDLPLKLEKITQTVYLQAETGKFYKTRIMPSAMIFSGEDIEQRNVLSLTAFDPYFLMLQILAKSRGSTLKINAETFQPKYLVPGKIGGIDWLQLADQNTVSGSQKTLLTQNEAEQAKVYQYKFNKEKVYAFLEKKVRLMEIYLHNQNPLDRLKLSKASSEAEKRISADTAILLKSQINEGAGLINQFIKDRYADQNICTRKIAPQVEDIESFKPKPQKKGSSVNKKNNKAPTSLQKNQQTLFAFSSKTQKKSQ